MRSRQPTTAKPTLLALPNDVLLTIRDLISDAPFTSEDPSLGLLAHVAVSRTSRQLRALYHFSSAEYEQRFWKRVCVGAGFGRPVRREQGNAQDAPPVMGWRRVAQLVAAHMRVCEIRSCREASSWFGSSFPSTTGARRVPQHCHTRPQDTAQKLAFHPLFYYLHFSPEGAALDPNAILFTHLPTYPDCRFKVYAPLAVHPSASCAFVTYPPVRKISFMRPGGDEDAVIASVFNPDGVTILDVNRLLADILPQGLTAMRTVLSHYQSLIDDYRGPTASFAETMARGLHRGFLGDHRYPFLPVDGSAEVGRPTPAAADVPLGPLAISCDSDGHIIRLDEKHLAEVLVQA
ncbi:hypothetical protein FA95DRAFT_1608186 [Auriscalpium vulgare]|uniref:Uncharacterized protein n=1 Tax=Auriscalpium vulgare TaxID=40419 RepID=A0ACB8RKX7_9AGAM|nr:hypothetical protein FA95DRAFT_1608186 [Auriscalpium vulgare]